VRKLIPYLIYGALRVLGCTLRFRVEDRCDVNRYPRPLIWTFWHNRLLGIPLGRLHFTPGRTGSALTSPSKDGEIVARVMGLFGLGSVRGSSSRRGRTAIRELTEVLACGKDIAITPDGPRGPMYKLAPGVIRLAQMTGTSVLPIHVHYSAYWELKSWDRFRIPKPFARVEIVFDTLHEVQPTAEGDDAAFEAECARLEERLKKEGRG